MRACVACVRACVACVRRIVYVVLVLHAQEVSGYIDYAHRLKVHPSRPPATRKCTSGSMCALVALPRSAYYSGGFRTYRLRVIDANVRVEIGRP
jgi:hypothetical protein